MSSLFVGRVSIPRVVYSNSTMVKNLVQALAHWSTLSSSSLVSVLDTMRNVTEKDDLEGQRCRKNSLHAIPMLSAILMEFAEGHESVAHGSDMNGVLIAALACLRYVTKGESENIRVATGCGVLTICRNLMARYADRGDVLKYCCMVFRSLTFNCPENQKEVVQLGVVPLILEAIRHFSVDAELQSAAFMSIQNITWLVEENRNVVERLGGIECILSAMAFHVQDVEVQKWGCGALQNLACCVLCTLKLIKARAVEVMLNSMARHADDATVQNYGLGVLRNIAFLPENRIQVAKSGAVALALDAISRHMHDVDVANSACSFFYNTVIGIPENCARVLEHNHALPIIFASRDTHLHEPKFAEKIASLLDQLSVANKGPYIAHMPATRVPTLMELAACAVAALPYDVQDDMVEDLVDMVVCAKACDWCKTLCITRVPAARKLNTNTCGWELFSLCGRRCVQAVVDDTMAQMATVEVPIVQIEVGVQ